MTKRVDPPALVLASTSRYRAALLERLGLPFEVVAPDVDEAALPGQELAPGALAARLAEAKALAVQRRRARAVVIGSDQVCACGGEVLGKPLTRERAVEQLLRLQGRAHELWTAVCIANPGGLVAFHDRTRLFMRTRTRAQLERYVDVDQPFDCAGSYRLEASGIALFERIESEDHTAIVGLPLLRLVRELAALGYDV